MSVQRARCTAGRLGHPIEVLSIRHQGALSVLDITFVCATLWRLFVPTLLLTLTVAEMVSVPLK